MAKYALTSGSVPCFCALTRMNASCAARSDGMSKDAPMASSGAPSPECVATWKPSSRSSTRSNRSFQPSRALMPSVAPFSAFSDRPGTPRSSGTSTPRQPSPVQPCCGSGAPRLAVRVMRTDWKSSGPQVSALARQVTVLVAPGATSANAASRAACTPARSRVASASTGPMAAFTSARRSAMNRCPCCRSSPTSGSLPSKLASRNASSTLAR